LIAKNLHDILHVHMYGACALSEKMRHSAVPNTNLKVDVILTVHRR